MNPKLQSAGIAGIFSGILLGLAVALSHAFPRWLGWTAAVAGSGSIGAGLVQAFTGKPTMASLVLTIIGPTVICLWLLVMGMQLLRNTVKRVKISDHEYLQQAQA